VAARDDQDEKQADANGKDGNEGPGGWIDTTVILQLLGAAAGLTVFLGLVGAQMRRAAFDALDLPADRAVGLIPKEELVSIGVENLLPNIVYAALVTWIVTATVKIGKEKLRWCDKPSLVLLGWLTLFLPVGVLAHALGRGLGFSVVPGLLVVTGVAVLGVIFVFSVVIKGPGDRRALAWLVFLVTVLVGATFNYMRTHEDPKLEPVALIRAGDEQGFSGYLIAETDAAVYIAPLPARDVSTALSPNRPKPDDILEVPREQVKAMRVADLAGFDSGDNGPQIADDLLLELRDEDAAARRLAAPETVTTDDPEETFAPVIHLHHQDPSLPTTADFFLQHSRLFWHHPRGCGAFDPVLGRHVDRPVAADGNVGVAAQRIGLNGGDPYAHSTLDGSRCSDAGRSFSATELTRPDDKARERPKDLPANEGFYLDLLNSSQGGEGQAHVKDFQGRAVFTGVPAYTETQEVESEDAVWITYWFFYPLSVPPHPRVELESARELVQDGISHEGDWERMSVLLRRGEGENEYMPAYVRFHIHNHSLNIPWSQVQRKSDGDGSRTHPVGYSARGSHATYPTAGRFDEYLGEEKRTARVKDIAISCDACPIWLTWTNLVQDVETEPWYGFGGAWGQLKPFSGPLGPSVYKLEKTDNTAELLAGVASPLATELKPNLEPGEEAVDVRE
jgi:hypothetical protein